MDTLSSFIRLAPYIPKLLGNDKLAVWTTDQEKYIFMEDRAGLVGIRRASAERERDAENRYEQK